MWELSANLHLRAFWLSFYFFSPQAIMDVSVSFTNFLYFLLSNANFNGSRVSSLFLCLFHNNLKWEWGGMSGKRKRKGCPKIKLNIYGMGECVHWGGSYIYLEIRRMCWRVCCLTLSVTHSAWAFGTDEVFHPVQWFGITLTQDTCDVWVCFCFICSQHVISLSSFSFLSLPVFAPSTGTGHVCSLTVLTTDCFVIVSVKQ